MTIYISFKDDISATKSEYKQTEFRDNEEYLVNKSGSKEPFTLT